MPRRQDPRDLSAAAQEYLLALRIGGGAGDGAKVTAAGVARHLGVTTQAASEMFRRLVADGLVDHVDGGRELRLTNAGRAAADAIFRRHALIEWLEVIDLRRGILKRLRLEKRVLLERHRDDPVAVGAGGVNVHPVARPDVENEREGGARRHLVVAGIGGDL